MKRVVVTGADGFIGTHFLKKCEQEETEVWAIVHPQYGNQGNICGNKGIHIINSTFEDLDQHIEEFPDQIDAFYHFAWIGVDANLRNKFEIQIQNINLCKYVLDFAIQLRPRVFIMPGSTNEYMYYGKPIDDSAIPSPQDAYGAVKVALRYLAQSYASQNNLGFIYAVITGIYAPDRRDNNVITYTIERLLKGEKPELTRLEQLWDYVYVDDAIEALYRIGKSGKDNSFYAIGKGDNQPLREYIYTIRNIINPTLPLGIGERPYLSEKMPSSCIDLSAIKRDTGYEPKVEFKDGIVEVINLIKNEIP